MKESYRSFLKNLGWNGRKVEDPFEIEYDYVKVEVDMLKMILLLVQRMEYGATKASSMG